MFDWFKNAYNDFIEWIKAIFNAVIDFFVELPIKILDGILSAISGLINSIPVPDFLNNGLNSLLSSVDPAVLYFLDQSAFPECMAILGSGLAFRLSRKLFTLGQW